MLDPQVSTTVPEADSRHELVRGLVYLHNRANANTAELHQACATIHAVVDLLVEQGVLDHDTLEAPQQETAGQMRRHSLTQRMVEVMQESADSKYTFQDAAEAACTSRLHLCRATCSRLSPALSREDVQEGVVR
jgi:hypothetical protein